MYVNTSEDTAKILKNKINTFTCRMFFLNKIYCSTRKYIILSIRRWGILHVEINCCIFAL